MALLILAFPSCGYPLQLCRQPRSIPSWLQALRTRNYEWTVKSTHSRADANCRLCHGSLESIQRLVPACPHLAPTRYVDRHNSIVHYIHWALSTLHQVPDVHRSHYRHCLKPVVYGKDVRLFLGIYCSGSSSPESQLSRSHLGG